MDNLQIIKGVQCYIDENGIVQLNLENVARGLGFVDNSKGAEYVRWNTVRGYLKDYGFSQEVAKDSFIPEQIFYLLAMKANNETAKEFQKIVAYEILPSIRKYGLYAIDDLIENPDLAIKAFTALKEEKEKNKRLELENAEKQREIEHKEEVIITLVDDVELSRKRAVLNRVVRYNHSNYRDRWALLYREFQNKYHIDLDYRLEKYNRETKPKCKNKLDYIDKVMGKVSELYEIACKLFENDVKALCMEMYGTVI